MERISAELLDLYRYVYEKHKSKAGDLYCALELLLDSLKSTRETIEESAINNIKFGKIDTFDELSEAVKRVNEFNNIETSISEYLDCFSLKSEADQDKELEDEPEIEEKRKIPNYKEYEVSQDKPHTLEESFTHRKVCGFSLNNNHYDVANWQAMLVSVCELLFQKDRGKFYQIINLSVFKGTVREYFVTRSTGEKNYVKLKNANIYVWTRHSANAICAILRQLLREFNIPINSLYVFLRADYTPLHDGSLESISNIPQKEEMKIGRFVHETMRKLSDANYHFSKEMMDSLLSDTKTKQLFGIGIPFFKEIKEHDNISQLAKDSKGYNRYWTSIFKFNEREFLIVSQWTNNNKDRFYRWYNNL